MVPYNINFASLMQIIYTNLRKSPSTHTVGVAYSMAGAVQPVEITNDDTLKGFLYLRRRREDDMENFQLILEVNEKQSGPDSAGIGSTPNSRVIGCVGNLPIRVSDMPSIAEEGCGSVPTPNQNMGLDEFMLFDDATQRRGSPPPQNCPPPQNSHPPPQNSSPLRNSPPPQNPHPPPPRSPPPPRNSNPPLYSPLSSHSVPSSSTRNGADDDTIV